MRPTVITGVTPESRCVMEEIFGPVVVVVPFETEEEVLGYANSTQYGLSAVIWSADGARAQRVASKVHSGIATHIHEHMNSCMHEWCWWCVMNENALNALFAACPSRALIVVVAHTPPPSPFPLCRHYLDQLLDGPRPAYALWWHEGLRYRP